jgi:hypothetical protein
MIKSYKPEIRVPGDVFTSNSLVFATYDEALESARALMDRWFSVIECRAVESNQPVNYKRVNGQDIPVEKESIS